MKNNSCKHNPHGKYIGEINAINVQKIPDHIDCVTNWCSSMFSSILHDCLI